ncbi:hypothetical protein GcM3_160001 [Golovinomyces cichoracearum]|uniref:Uncharacterized protein n=1 Tax=Golovinomyces cichoracearum TaxID=62708 RepID=A0A420HU92_9PEZI|nr:hypothetical protein GcM3_160001 [Golovinomyces cichoracearum]
MSFRTLHRVSIATWQPIWPSIRRISTLPNNPHIYYFSSSDSHVLSYLPTDPPTLSLSIGKTTQIPPTPKSFTENSAFLPILHSVIAQHAVSDPQIQGQAAAFVSGSVLSSGIGNSLFGPRHTSGKRSGNFRGTSGDIRSRGGWIHISDNRSPLEYGRIALPEDIFGSIEVDSTGAFVDGGEKYTYPGRYQESGTYRIVTADGILGLSDFLRGKLVEKLRELEKGRAGL